MKGDEKRILEVGSGTGVVSLILAQRSENFSPTILAIDADGCAAALSSKNFSLSPWKERLSSVHLSLAEFALQQSDIPLFDLIVSNPPYYDNSLPAEGESRNMARHTLSLSYRDILAYADRHLSPEGSISLILPAEEEARLKRTAASFGFFISKITYLRTSVKKNPKRIVVMLSRERNVSFEPRTVTIGDETYQALTKEFYL